MAKIIRTKTEAKGGITAEEKARMDEHAKLWISRAMRTDPIDASKILPAIEGIYAAANLKKPRVVIVPSPLVMAFAYGASSAILYARKKNKDDATYAATRAATYDATYDATDAATDAATRAATYDATLAATLAATYDATDAATLAATYDATDDATYDATRAATYDATRAATYDATLAATYDATLAATDAATYDATDAATRAATRAATLAATDAATYAATRAATRAATLAATRAATYDATRAATYDATLAATRAATRAATLAATRAATLAATYAATYAATLAATRAATLAATRAATRAATYDATRAATYDANFKKIAEKGAALACFDLAGELGIQCSTRWHSAYQGGNMWAGYDSYLTACRDILGLELRSHEGYAHWEKAAIHGGFRVMHEEFCIVSDFPETLKVDDQNRPHCENGPSHRWRDGWCLYYWHGVQVPAEWIENRESINPIDILKTDNVEQRAAGAAIVGWPKMLEVLEAKVIDSDPDPDHGDLLEVRLPGLSEPGLFLRAYCKRNGLIVEGVPKISDIDGNPIKTVRAAQAWSFGKAEAEFTYPDFVS